MLPFDLENAALFIEFLRQRLTADDRTAYFALCSKFLRFEQTHNHSGPEEFYEQIAAVHDFICRSDYDSSLRAMICGIFFGGRFVLVNTLRLKDLLRRSKSGMNGCFQRLGYDVMRPSNEIVQLFDKLLPDVDQRAFQIKQWCLRIETRTSKVTWSLHIPAEIVMTFEVQRIPPRNQAQAWPLDIRCLLNREPPVGRDEDYPEFSCVSLGHLRTVLGE
jgi:hypothetical protein